jgi:DnaJ-domain-containing protein 1
MLITVGAVVLFGVLAGVLFGLRPESERARLNAAREQLQRLGYRLTPGTAAETRALRRLLEGRHPDLV